MSDVVLLYVQQAAGRELNVFVKVGAIGWSLVGSWDEFRHLSPSDRVALAKSRIDDRERFHRKPAKSSIH